MRILHIVNHFKPSIGYQETFLAKIQSEKGHDVRVITSDDYDPTLVGISIERIRNKKEIRGLHLEEGVEVVRLPGIMHHPLSNMVFLRGLGHEITEFNPDAIHVHGVIHLTALRVALMRNGFKKASLIFDDHMTYAVIRGRSVIPFYKIYKAFFARMIERRSDMLVAITQDTKRFMEKIYGFHDDRIRVIPLGCDTRLFKRDMGSRMRLREKYGIEKDTILFCNAGKFTPKKGIHTLVQAAIQLLAEKRNIAVLCVGSGDQSYLDSIRKEIEDNNLIGKFIFIPQVPNSELPMYYSMADIGVWPREVSITMLEAMSCNLPIIISDKSVMIERIVSGSTGEIYREDDILDLKTKMEKLLDLDLLTRMGIEARRYAEKNDWRIISEQFERLYSRTYQ